jgi:hypothetical protein
MPNFKSRGGPFVNQATKALLLQSPNDGTNLRIGLPSPVRQRFARAVKACDGSSRSSRGDPTPPLRAHARARHHVLGASTILSPATLTASSPTRLSIPINSLPHPHAIADRSSQLIFRFAKELLATISSTGRNQDTYVRVSG